MNFKEIEHSAYSDAPLSAFAMPYEQLTYYSLKYLYLRLNNDTLVNVDFLRDEKRLIRHNFDLLKRSHDDCLKVFQTSQDNIKRTSELCNELNKRSADPEADNGELLSIACDIIDRLIGGGVTVTVRKIRCNDEEAPYDL